eukprot:6445177-Prymnesium_polylepis.1
MHHAAEPAVDEKWVSQLWVRAHADPCVPLGDRATDPSLGPTLGRVLAEVEALPSRADSDDLLLTVKRA